MRLLTDNEYNERMRELGLVENSDYGKYFLGDMAFLMNVGDDVNELGDLIKFSENHPSYMSQVLMDYSMRGAKLVIGPGTIDEYGVKQKKAVYCTNYKELYAKQDVAEKYTEDGRIITDDGLFYSNYDKELFMTPGDPDGKYDPDRTLLFSLCPWNFSQELLKIREKYGVKVGKPQPWSNGVISDKQVGVYIVDYKKYLKDIHNPDTEKGAKK